MNKFLFLLLFVFQMNAQDTIVFPKVDAFKRNILEVSYGKPLGALSNKYDFAVTTSFFMRTKIANSQFVDFGLSLSGIVRGNSVNYQVGSESLVLDGSKTGLFLGFRYAAFLVQSKNENFHIESLTGLGWTYLHYSKPDDPIYEELDLKPTLHTIGIIIMRLMIYLIQRLNVPLGAVIYNLVFQEVGIFKTQKSQIK
ncbi:MAG: hypothetical protein MUF43_10750 [Flavobacterium sp.]|nr:hypothetical protein [Flavobacterium sp.]